MSSDPIVVARKLLDAIRENIRGIKTAIKTARGEELRTLRTELRAARGQEREARKYV